MEFIVELYWILVKRKKNKNKLNMNYFMGRLKRYDWNIILKNKYYINI